MSPGNQKPKVLRTVEDDNSDCEGPSSIPAWGNDIHILSGATKSKTSKNSKEYKALPRCKRC